MTRRRVPGRRRLALVLGAVLVLGFGCSTGPTLRWSLVPLPEDAQPTTLTAGGSDLLVGAQVSAGRVRPRLFSVADDARATPIALAPMTPYAYLARFVSVSEDRGQLTAVGGAPGGAHSNTRWTTWTGTLAGVRETPQSFSTFGGYGAGSLVGSTATGRGPVLAGSWQGAETRLDGAVWLSQGDRWVRQPSVGTALESTPSLLVGLRSVAGSGDRLVAPGSVVRLEPGHVTQTAAVWRSDRMSSGWTRIDLPEAEPPSEAVAAGCTASECLVAGHVHGTYALWRLTSDGAVRVGDVPPLPAADDTPIPAPLTRGGHAIGLVATGAGSAVLIETESGWRRSDGPVGVPSSTALVGDWLYAVAQDPGGRASLWRADVRALG